MTIFKKILLFVIFISVVGLIAGVGVIYWGYLYITRDLPNFASVDDYRPPAVTKVFARDGTVIAEFFKERRYPVKLHDIPAVIRNAFLAAEDEGFYRHTGVDFQSVLRAAVKNFQSGSSKQGGSTITQQVVKNLLLTSEKNLKRKIKEAILSYRLEKRVSKDGILEIYLNQIFFGNTAYGIKAAAHIYFHKELDQITLGEAAILAGLPKAPSEYSPIRSMSNAKKRQHYVLGRMVTAGFITQKQADDANLEKIEVFKAPQENIYNAHYYVNEARSQFKENPLWKDLDIDNDGLRIYTAADTEVEKLARVALQSGVRAVDKRRGWRGPKAHFASEEEYHFTVKYGNKRFEDLEKNTLYPALVTNINKAQGIVDVNLGSALTTVNVKEAAWAKKKIGSDGKVQWIKVEEQLRAGDVIEVSIVENEEKNVKALPERAAVTLKLDQTPDLEGALVLLDPNSGEVVVDIGGYSYQKSQFNRVTQSYRQPGSSFKPIVYFTALDQFAYTPATIIEDRPATFKVGDEYWTPQNFDEKYLGPITLQKALEQSRNLISVHIASRIGLSPIIQYAQKFGIKSPLGKNLSLALGSSEVTMLEMARAYGVFAAKGVLFDSVFITRILDREGREIFNYDQEKLLNAKQVVSDKSAFIMSHMMKGVVERGTATSIKALGRPSAGKTGTTNDQMDAWYIGYTPSWVCGVWVGFDLKKEIGEKETGGKVAAPIWLNFMKQFLDNIDTREYEELVKKTKEESERLGVDFVVPERLSTQDFSPPKGVDLQWMNLISGISAQEGDPGAVSEYFIEGTGPNKTLTPIDDEPVDIDGDGIPDENPDGNTRPSGSAEDQYLESPDL